MKRLIFIFIICIIMFSSCINEEKKEPLALDTLVLRYAESEKEGSYQAQLSNYFASLVEEKSNGKIIIKVYYNGELGTEEEVLTQLQFGGIALGRVNLLSLSQQIPSFRSTFFPYLNSSFTKTLDFINNNKNFNFAFQNEKLFPLITLYPSSRCVYSDESLDQINYNELKIGIDNSYMYEKFLKRWGANPIVIGDIDTFPSLRNGFIDARESSLSSFLTCDEYPYIQDVVILENVCLPSFITISNEVLNQLSKQELEILINCAKDTQAYAKSFIEIEEIKAINKISYDKNIRELYE
ncbi:MAG: TRAP transporter substrate-binding protein DctP [Sphaerochaetaceae bacterium]|nr:TRAP transporter substrate-binding protein DctP [Sphaerochaetaceae bacterium]MDC7237293.1 TRAP transporter substrate-binding protein DctP [Sphaerochaetaceae bacterium]MDC7250625.1 TRAP transporter substrate-binding protein DctP [Sphaerochaetaceae bacterium]